MKCGQIAVSALLIASGAGLAMAGPDVSFCELYGLSQRGRVGTYPNGTVGLAIATTSHNVGNTPLLWFQSSDPRHPFIAQNLFRLSNDRFEHIGESWVKHGFFALASTQCGGSCPGNAGGTQLGVNCTDTYSASLNGSQSNNTGLGPRFEINPWTGGWSWTGSIFDPAVPDPVNTGITRRMQVLEQDMLVPGAQYFVEAWYCHYQDENVMNSSAWKPVSPVPPTPPSSTWGFTMSGFSTFPNIGFAVDAWTGAMQTMIAQQLPVQEFVSPDGRAILAAKSIAVTELGDGTYRYEYFLYNIDMDRQIGSFSIPVADNVTVTDVGFHAVRHHDEPFNTVAADKVAITNDPWTWSHESGALTWSTTNNPLRWGFGYNFWFTADQAPDPANVEATVGLFRAGSPTSLPAVTIGPLAPPATCDGDADGSMTVDVNDISYVVFRLGLASPNDQGADVDGSLFVDVNDISYVIFRLGTCN